MSRSIGSKRPTQAALARAGFKLEGIAATVEVRRHPAARRLTLRVSRTQRAVILTLPVHSDLREASRFLDRNLDWLRERLDAVPHAAPFHDGASIPLRGDTHYLRFTGVLRAARIVRRIEGCETRPHTIEIAGSSEYAPRRLLAWLMDEAGRDLSARVAVHAAQLGLNPSRLTVRDQKSRWGSCSSTGQLSFSWRLILAPPHVLDYVAAHEVAHLAEMNHGPRFWALVARTCPELQRAKCWLTDHGADLHRYGIES